MKKIGSENKICYNKLNAYVTLLSVLIVGAIGISITVSLLLLGVGSSRTSFTGEQSGKAKSLSSACAEEALEKIRELETYAGSSNFSLNGGTCAYTVTNQGGANRAIIASSTVGTLTRKSRVIINQINPTIQIVSWQEVSD